MAELKVTHTITPSLYVIASSTLRANSKIVRYCNFAYSAFACFRIGISGSASFHSVKKS